MATNGVSASSAPVALITGAASGMGLSVTKRLIERGYNVAMVDLNAEAGFKLAQELGQQAVFIKANISDYEEQASAFAETWSKWHRLDFVFANAGFGDRMNFFATAEERGNGTPARPDISVMDTCLTGVVWSAYLALHFFRKNPNKAGKLVSTSSMCGLYPGEGIPLYTAAKHGVVGLTLALSKKLAQLGEPITVNCICPGLVDTGLTGVLIDVSPEKHVTPHSTIETAVFSFIDDDKKNGLAAECSVEKIHYRTQRDFLDEDAKWVMTTRFDEIFKAKFNTQN